MIRYFNDWTVDRMRKIERYHNINNSHGSILLSVAWEQSRSDLVVLRFFSHLESSSNLPLCDFPSRSLKTPANPARNVSSIKCVHAFSLLSWKSRRHCTIGSMETAKNWSGSTEIFFTVRSTTELGPLRFPQSIYQNTSESHCKREYRHACYFFLGGASHRIVLFEM